MTDTPPPHPSSDSPSIDPAPENPIKPSSPNDSSPPVNVGELIAKQDEAFDPWADAPQPVTPQSAEASPVSDSVPGGSPTQPQPESESPPADQTKSIEAAHQMPSADSSDPGIRGDSEMLIDSVEHAAPAKAVAADTTSIEPSSTQEPSTVQHPSDGPVDPSPSDSSSGNVPAEKPVVDASPAAASTLTDSAETTAPKSSSSSSKQTPPAASPETPAANQRFEPKPKRSPKTNDGPSTEFAPGEVPFAELPLADEVRRAVELAGYRTATAIQSAIIPPMVERRDVLAQSQTGSGKTAAFALPVLTNLDTRDRSIQCLVLTPTRELAMQVSRSFTGYGEEVRGLNVTAIYGGQDYQPQLRSLNRGSQVVVGTPGRVIDHIKRKTIDLSQLQTLVLDEADEMLNMGFLEDVEFVLKQTPSTRQIALFSATMPGPIAKLSKKYLNDPVRVSIDTQTLTADSIRQRAVFVPPRDKLRLLKRFLETETTEGVIVFVKTRDATVTLAESLTRDGFSASAINGDMPQNVRERTIAHLKSGRLNILVATDVAARGLDVQRISHVFNFDLPHDSESYVHRVGRTGRAGRAGEAIIFLSNSQRHRLRTITRVTGQEIEVVDPPAVESVNSKRAESFAQRINETIKNEDLTLLRELIGKHVESGDQSIEDVAAALAHLNQRGRPFFLNEDPIGPVRGRRDRDDRRSPRDDDDGGDGGQRRGKRFGPPGDGMVRYRLAVGHRDNIHVGNIVGAVANEAGLTNKEIGPIRIHESFSTIDLPAGMPGDIFQTLQRTRVGGRPLAIREWSDAPPRGRAGGKPGGKPGGRSGGGKFGGGRFDGDKPRKFKKKFDGPPKGKPKKR